MNANIMIKNLFIDPLVSPYIKMWRNINKYRNAATNAVLSVRCKQGKLIINQDNVWLALPNFGEDASQNDFRLRRETIMGVQVSKGFGVSYNIIIHAKGCKEIHADWIQPKALDAIVSLLGYWNENMSYGTIQEVVEHFLSLGYILLSRDDNGAQLHKNIGGRSVGIATPMPLGTTLLNTKMSSSSLSVYVRADGSVIKRHNL